MKDNGGAPHRDVYYTGANAKPFVRDAGTFDNFFYIKVNKDTTRITCVKFESVNGVFDTQNDQLGGDLPSNAVLWNPANGNEVIITNPIQVNSLSENQSQTSSVYPTNVVGEFTIEFSKPFEKATIEIYNSLGKLCQSQEISNQEKQAVSIGENCSGVSYVYVKFDHGMVESHRIIINKN